MRSMAASMPVLSNSTISTSMTVPANKTVSVSFGPARTQRESAQGGERFLAKSSFVPARAQARQRVARGVPDTVKSAAVFLRIDDGKRGLFRHEWHCVAAL